MTRSRPERNGGGSGRGGGIPRWIGSRRAVGALVVVMLAASCGTRLTRAEIVAENRVGGSAVAAGQANQPGTGNAISNGANPSYSPGAATNGSGATAAIGPSSSGSSSAAGHPTVAASTAGAGGAQCTSQATGTPLVVGFVGDLSGFGASTSVPSQELWTAWAKNVNSKGGINCHPVQILVGDDGGSTSEDATIAQQFVQNQGAIALSWASTDPSAISSFAQSNSVPVIGTETGGAQWTTNPMMFAPFGIQEAGVYGSVQAAKADGATKLGIFYCVESPAVCSSTAQMYSDDANAQGVSVVYSGGISLTQPDYTANCLQARNAGVQLLYVLGDTNTEIRVAQSCSRQAYNPIYELPEAEDSFGSVPQLNNALSVTSSFPWMLHSGSPALDEYGQILQRYAPDLLQNGQGTQTWGYVSAKVFGEAALLATANLKPTDKVTSQNILNGLWSMTNDNVGGLDPGPLARTFPRGKVAATAWCVFVEKLAGGRWNAPQGMTPLCR